MGRQYIEPAMFNRLSGLAASVSDRIAAALPSQCAVCRAWQDERICAAAMRSDTEAARPDKRLNMAGLNILPADACFHLVFDSA